MNSHLPIAQWAQQWEHLVDAGVQHGPQVGAGAGWGEPVFPSDLVCPGAAVVDSMLASAVMRFYAHAGLHLLHDNFVDGTGRVKNHLAGCGLMIGIGIRSERRHLKHPIDYTHMSKLNANSKNISELSHLLLNQL